VTIFRSLNDQNRSLIKTVIDLVTEFVTDFKN